MRELQLGIMFSIANASKSRMSLSASDVTQEDFGLEVTLVQLLCSNGCVRLCSAGLNSSVLPSLAQLLEVAERRCWVELSLTCGWGFASCLGSNRLSHICKGWCDR